MHFKSFSPHGFRAALCLGLGLAAAACGGGSSDDAEPAGTPEDPPASVGGEYAVTLTNGASTCTTLTWTAGMQSTASFNIKQTGTKLTGEVGGDAALQIVILTGANSFKGEIHGSDFSLTDKGPRANMAGACKYTVDALVAGTVDGDTISGTLIYKSEVTSDPACADYDCQVESAFEGALEAE